MHLGKAKNHTRLVIVYELIPLFFLGLESHVERILQALLVESRLFFELYHEGIFCIKLQLLLDDLVKDAIELDKSLSPLSLNLDVKLLLDSLEKFHFNLISDLLDVHF